MEARALIEGRAAAQRLIAGDQTRRRGEAQVIAALCDLAETYRLDEADLLDSLAERRVRVGGEGTPSVSEHLRLEIAGLLGCTPAAATGRLADAINLKYRHPRLYDAVQLLEIDATRALKAAARCCDLHPALADPVTSRWLRRQRGLGWSAAFTLLDKLIIQADTALAAEKERKARADRGVWTWGLFDGVMNLTGRLDALDAQLLESRLDQVAALLEARYPTLTHSQRRAKALTLDPRLAASLLDGAPQPGLPLEATCGCSATSAQVASTPPEMGRVPATSGAPSHQTAGPNCSPPTTSRFVGSARAVPQPCMHSALPDLPSAPRSPVRTTATGPESTGPAERPTRAARPPAAWVLETTERDGPRSHRPDAEPGESAPARPRFADPAPARPLEPRGPTVEPANAAHPTRTPTHAGRPAVARSEVAGGWPDSAADAGTAKAAVSGCGPASAPMEPSEPAAGSVAEPSGASNARPGPTDDGSTLPARPPRSSDVAPTATEASVHGEHLSPNHAKAPSRTAQVHGERSSLAHPGTPTPAAQVHGEQQSPNYAEAPSQTAPGHGEQPSPNHVQAPSRTARVNGEQPSRNHPGTPNPAAQVNGEQQSPDRAEAPSPAPVLHLNVHLQADSLGHLDGAARVERVGHITTALLAELLGELALDVRVQPVIDLPRMAPADRYEPTPRMRRAVQLAFPTEPFPFSNRSTTGSGSAGLPFSSRRTSGVDLDHTDPYRPGAKDQTRIGNLAPLSRGVHRAKTAGFWVLDQPSPGQLVWTSPLGYRYDVTEIGTRRQAAQAVEQTA